MTRTYRYTLSSMLLLPPSFRKPPHQLTSQLAPCQSGRHSLTPPAWVCCSKRKRESLGCGRGRCQNPYCPSRPSTQTLLRYGREKMGQQNPSISSSPHFPPPHQLLGPELHLGSTRTMHCLHSSTAIIQSSVSCRWAHDQ